MNAAVRVGSTAGTKLIRVRAEAGMETEVTQRYEAGAAAVEWLMAALATVAAMTVEARAAGDRDWKVELPVRAPPPHMDELEREYPEIVELREKLQKGELDSRDEWNLRELCEATGWDEDDVKDELVNIDKDPAEREEVYVNLFNKYYGEARRLREKGDDVQAAEKLWGAITALVKAYSCRKGVFVAHWGRGKLDRFVEKNVENELKEKFSDLLTFGGELHEHFFERHLPSGKFDRRWNQCTKLIDELKLRLIRR